MAKLDRQKYASMYGPTSQYTEKKTNSVEEKL